MVPLVETVELVDSEPVELINMVVMGVLVECVEELQ